MHKIQRFLLTAFAVFVCGAFSVSASDWPAFRGNMQRTGYYLKSNIGPPASKWAWKASLPGPVYSSPAVHDSLLFIGAGDSAVYGLDSRSGTVLWKFKTGDLVESSPLYSGDRVYVGSNDGYIYALDASTGRKLARYIAGLQLSSCAVVNSELIVSGVGMPQSGLGFYKTSDLPLQGVARPDTLISLPMITYASPAVSGSAVVVGSTDGGLSCFDLSGYRLRWNVKTAGNMYMSSPAIAGSTVYCAPGDFDPYVYAIDIGSGRVLWASAGNQAEALAKRRAASAVNTKLVRSFLHSSPEHQAFMMRKLGSHGMDISVLQHLSVLYAGGIAKRQSTSPADFVPDGSDIKTSSVAVDAARVYVINKEPGYPLPRFSIKALDRSAGNESWKAKFIELRSCIPIGFCSSPVVAGNSVFFGWGEGKVYALSAENGAVQWQDSLSGDIISSPAITEDKLYFATATGFLYAFNLATATPGGDFKTNTFCYPNPARGSVSHIQMSAAKGGTIDMTLFSMADRPVVRFSKQFSTAEMFTYDWDLSHVANGVYFALIKVKYADGTSDSKVLKVAVLH